MEFSLALLFVIIFDTLSDFCLRVASRDRSTVIHLRDTQNRRCQTSSMSGIPMASGKLACDSLCENANVLMKFPPVQLARSLSSGTIWEEPLRIHHCFSDWVH